MHSDFCASHVRCTTTFLGKTATDTVERAGVFNKGRAGASDAMPVDAVVDQTLAQLGRRTVIVPGWCAKLHVFMRSYLPRFIVRYVLDRPVLLNAQGIMQVLPYSAQPQHF
jgi:short-subunit dehydrogenase